MDDAELGRSGRELAVALHEKVQALFEATQKSLRDSEEHWPTVVLDRLREQHRLAPDHIYASSFALEGRIGEIRVKPVRGRLVLR